jgi:hypothetical protein
MALRVVDMTLVQAAKVSGMTQARVSDIKRAAAMADGRGFMIGMR